jgi:hypothetical protein
MFDVVESDTDTEKQALLLFIPAVFSFTTTYRR